MIATIAILTKAKLASRDGNLERVKELLEKGANIDLQNTNGDTALMMASVYGKVEIVKLIEKEIWNRRIPSSEKEGFPPYLLETVLRIE